MDDRISIREHDGAEIKSIHQPGGYGGSTAYEITGSEDAVSKAVDRIISSYPPAGYGTWFNWPPGVKKYANGEPCEYKKPIEVEPGKWRAFGDHSNSCE